MCIHADTLTQSTYTHTAWAHVWTCCNKCLHTTWWLDISRGTRAHTHAHTHAHHQDEKNVICVITEWSQIVISRCWPNWFKEQPWHFLGQEISLCLVWLLQNTDKTLSIDEQNCAATTTWYCVCPICKYLSLKQYFCLFASYLLHLIFARFLAHLEPNKMLVGGVIDKLSHYR